MTLIRCIDVETTGLADDAAARVCEVGICDLELAPEPLLPIELPRSWLCNPGVAIPAVARAVHHISDADVAGLPTSAEVVAALPGTPDLYCAHNAPFEQHFLPSLAGRPWLCTYRIACRLWIEAPAFSNQVLRYHLDLKLNEVAASPPHRAGPDAYVTAHLLARAVQEQRCTLDDMIRWSSGPPLLPRVTFGQHYGKPWDTVPDDYLDWIANKSDLDQDIKANARHHIKKRRSAP